MSNNNVIPAESLGQWRSWSVGELGGSAPAESVSAAPPPQVLEAEPQPEKPPVEGASVIVAEEDVASVESHSATAYPTAAELEAIHQEAWQAGYDAGMAAGREAGEAQGRAEGAERALQEAQKQFDEYWQPLMRLQKAFEDELAVLGGHLSQEVLSLSVTFAEKMVGEIIRHDPAVLRALLTEALDSLADSVLQVKIQVHPEELATLQAFLGDQYPQWRMQWVPDASLMRGGCRVVTPSAVLDLSLEGRLHLLKKGLGIADEQAD